MDKYKYLYIDDALDEAKSTAQGIDDDLIVVDAALNKGSWENQLSDLKTKYSDIDGLILDLRLSDNEVEGGRADFMGSSLGQEIRSRQRDGEIPYYPIVMFSGNEKIKEYYGDTDSSVFDIIVSKGDGGIEFFGTLSRRLWALADAYKTIKKNNKNVDSLLDIDNFEDLDDRFLSALETAYAEKPEKFIHFLIKQMISHQGILIDEDVLASRLGIDIEHSQDWYKVKQFFKSCRYDSILSYGWDRWWAYKVEKMWETINPEQPFLQMVGAKERVDKIRAFTDCYNISPAQPLQKAESTRFWTICQAYRKPLDPVDGLMIKGESTIAPWLEPLYVSIEGALTKKNHDRWKDIENFEKERLESYKDKPNERPI